MQTAILIAQTLATASLAGWLTTGVRDNLLQPSLNATYTAEVMNMTRMRTEYPEAFAEVAHRAVSNPATQRLAFRVVVAAELIATVILWAGTVALLMAIAGTAEPATARSLALLGTTAFTAIWSGMLIVGNHFSYWFCHEAAQNTHYQMTLWGIGTSVLIIAGS